ncbi:MAG: sodium/proton antiporter, partial [Porticoccaceae bacterium]|nr:sodium/proton antiporter [Porticoccaceae bacterium]
MATTLTQAFKENFLGDAPDWYKTSIIAFLVLNPIILLTAGPVVAGWALIGEFIFTLAMALKCYPLQPGGLLAIEAIILGMASPDAVYMEVSANLQVILLLMFMVAGIYFMRDMLLFVFTKILLSVKSKTTLSFMFCFAGAFLSAFLDALTVTAVLITISVGFYSVYHKIASGKLLTDADHDHTSDASVLAENEQQLDDFRAFLRSLIMHGAVGTALGGVCTTVGEPQNLLIAERAGWEFIEFFVRMAPVTMPVLACGLICCILLEKSKIFGYGAQLPDQVRIILQESSNHDDSKRTQNDNAALIVQCVVAVILV